MGTRRDEDRAPTGSDRRRGSARSSSRRSSSGHDDELYWFGIVVLLVVIAGVRRSWPELRARLGEWWPGDEVPGAGAGTTPESWGRWALFVGVALVALAVVRALVRRRRDARARIAERVATEVQAGAGLPRARVDVRRWRGLDPRRIVVSDPAVSVSPIEVIEAAVATTLGGAWTAATRGRRRTAVVLTRSARPERDQEPAGPYERVERIVREAIPSAREVTVSAEDDEPAEVVVTYAPATRLATRAAQSRIEQAVSTMLPGRWRAQWEPTGDRVTFERRPGLPELVGPFLDVPDGSPVLRYALAEGGEVHGWRLDGPEPHALVIGPTGGGKTSAIRAMVLDAVRQGVEVVCADPKRIELLGLRGWPGVSWVATEAREMAQVIAAAHAEMERRYALIEAGRARRDELRPLLVVLDEFLILRDRLERVWAEDREKSDPRHHPALGMVSQMAALARSARIHLLVGIQRPDAEFIGGAARDNFRHRVSLSKLSMQGALMLWDSPAVGVDMAKHPGRAMASGPFGPREVQCVFVPDPDPRQELSAEDRAVLDRLRPEHPPAPTLGPVAPRRGTESPAPRRAAADAAAVSPTPAPAASSEAGGDEAAPEPAGDGDEWWHEGPAESVVAGDLVRLDPDSEATEVLSVAVDAHDEDYVCIETADGIVSVPATEAVSIGSTALESELG